MVAPPERDAGTTRDLGVAAPRQRRGLIGVARKHGQKSIELAHVVAKIGRQLPQEGAELVAQVGDAGGEEVRERRLDVVKTQHVRDIAGALDAEDEALWRVVVPGGVIFGARQPKTPMQIAPARPMASSFAALMIRPRRVPAQAGEVCLCYALE